MMHFLALIGSDEFARRGIKTAFSSSYRLSIFLITALGSNAKNYGKAHESVVEAFIKSSHDNKKIKNKLGLACNISYSLVAEA
jgi:hypothetical protein